jgi:hypothetical protein
MYQTMRISLLIAVAGAVVAGFSQSSAGDPTPKLVTEHFMIDASDPNAAGSIPFLSSSSHLRTFSRACSRVSSPYTPSARRVGLREPG